MMKLLKYNSVKVALGVICMESIMEVLMSYALAYLVVETKEMLLRNALLVLGIYLLSSIFLYLSTRAKEIACFYVRQDITQKTDKYISKLNYTSFNKREYSSWGTLYINDASEIIRLTLEKMFSMYKKIFTSIFAVVALFKIHYTMVLVAGASFILMAVVPNLFQKKLALYIQQVQDGKENYLSKMNEILQGFNTFLENSAFDIFLKKSRKAAYNYSKITLGAEKYAGFMSASLTFVNSVATIGALALVSFYVIEGKVMPGAFLSVVALLPIFGSSVMEFLAEREFYKSGLALYDQKFSKLIDEKHEEEVFFKKITESDEVLNIENSKPKETFVIDEVNMKDIVVDYDGKKIVMPSDIRFQKGKKYAIVGKSGSGKSTLLKVLLNEVENFSGDVKLNTSKSEDNSLFDGISYVNQNTFLFNDTIRNNIDILNEHSDSEVREVLDILDLSEFNLDDEIKENGKNLSGGQRQRISIARAILRKRDFVLLDEATSSLDEETSLKVENYLLDNSKTLVMITHHLRDSIKSRLDEIIYLG